MCLRRFVTALPNYVLVRERELNLMYEQNKVLADPRLRVSLIPPPVSLLSTA